MSGSGDGLRRNSRRKSIRISKKKVNNYFSEYCDSTSIHGFKYLGEQDRSCLEKLWWLITIVCSLGICVYLIFLTYEKWERSPVIVSFATKQTPIWHIPFPSVTICPETKARQSAYNLTQMYHLLKARSAVSEEDRRHFEYVSLICSVDDVRFRRRTVGEECLEFLEEIAPSISSIAWACTWMGEQHNCSQLFTPIWTDEGVCFTFNMLDREQLFKKETMTFYKDFLKINRTADWTLVGGYKSDSKSTYPRRALFSGAKAGLTIDLVSYDDDLDYICGDSLQGYKILLTHPAETPQVTQQYFRVPLNQTVVAAVKPDIMTTSESLKSYMPERRKCYFPDEKELYYFKVYTQKNCEVECLSNFTLHKCGCVDFHMPRAVRTPICGAAKIDCMKNAESQLLSSVIDEKLKQEEEEKQQQANGADILESSKSILKFVEQGFKNTATNKTETPPKKKRRTGECDCLPSCSSLNYNIETSQSDWEWAKRFEGLKLDYSNFEGKQMYLSKLVVFFKDTQFIASERNELYGKTDFLANCGGLLGLFTGFSFISLVEIVYFLSLRCLCNIRRHGRKYWAGI